MKHTRNKSNGMMKHMQLLAVLLVPVVALIMGGAVANVWARGDRHWFGVEEFEDAACGFEVNLTDFDTGFRACVDAEGWKWLQIYRKGENNKDRQLLLSTWAAGNLSRLGITELCFESSEPERSFQEILDLFPEGECKFIGKTVEHKYLRSTTDLSHDFACGAQGIKFNGIAYDPEDPPCVPTDADLVVSWEEVDTKLTELTDEDEFECENPFEPDDEIEGYEVVVEAENQELFFNLPAETTQVTVPATFLAEITMEEEMPKVEILVLFGANKSIREFEFVTCPSP